MNQINTNKIEHEEGIYIKYHDDYFTFRLTDDELIVFEEVNASIFNEFELRSGDYIGAPFHITYQEVVRDADEDDYIVFRLLKLEIIE